MDRKKIDVRTVKPDRTTGESSADSTTLLGKWKISSEKELGEWAEKFKDHLSSDQVILLKGAMGSGKTTLVVHLMRALKGDQASSPTFSIVNEYGYPEGILYHFDLYRIDHPEELIEIGFEEYLDREAISLIEWPDKGEAYYREEHTSTITIDRMKNDDRIIQWFKGIVL